MSDSATDKVVEGKLADPVDLFYIELGQETYKRNVPFLNEVLSKLITLNASLLGGGLYFLKEDVIPSWSRVLAVIFFLIATLVAFLGILPYSGTINPFDPKQV